MSPLTQPGNVLATARRNAADTARRLGLSPQLTAMIMEPSLCNAGGVFVSYLEYTQETQRDQMTLEEVNARLAAQMQTTINRVHERASQQTSSMREAAMDIAVSSVVDGIQRRGLLP